MVKREIIMNDSMHKIYFSESHKPIQSNKINSIIKKQLSNICVNYYQEHKWLANRSSNYSYLEIIDKFNTLSAFEWETEFFFDKKLIHNNWNKAIQFILQSFEKLLGDLNLGNHFLITIIGQYGEFENFNVRLQYYREKEANVNNLLQSHQPIFCAILEYINNA